MEDQLHKSSTYSILQFQPFCSSVDVSFWHELCKRKLEVYRLSEDAVELAGHFATGTPTSHNVSRLFLEASSFDMLPGYCSSSAYLKYSL